MHKALYRLYRPALLGDVVGQGHITATLLNELREGKLAHAYLFTGTRGTGKTTTAKILAKAVNCLDPQGGEPCLACRACTAIEEGTVLDVAEIDAASNSSVGNIRELREEAFFAPIFCRYRVYIIDEVHMLSTEAFNALLKIMEEPPEHVLFILATTEAHKVPATILSRCQRFDFHRLSVEVIADQLQKIAGLESFSLPRAAAEVIARVADGSMRDALSILEKCASVSDDLTEQEVRAIVGVADARYLSDIAGALARNDGAALIGIVAGLYRESKDIERLTAELATYFRDLLVTASGGAPRLLSTFIDPEVVSEQAALFAPARLMAVIAELGECLARFLRTRTPYLELELTLLRLSNPEAAAALQIENAPPARAEAAAPASPKSGVPRRPAAHSAPAAAAPETSPAAGLKSQPIAPPPDALATASVPAPALHGEDESAVAEWPDILREIEKLNRPLRATLEQSRAVWRGGRILIDAPNPMFKPMVGQSEQAKASIKAAMTAVLGRAHPIGPYEPPEGGLQDLLRRARELGVPVDEP